MHHFRSNGVASFSFQPDLYGNDLFGGAHAAAASLNNVGLLFDGLVVVVRIDNERVACRCEPAKRKGPVRVGHRDELATRWSGKATFQRPIHSLTRGKDDRSLNHEPASRTQVRGSCGFHADPLCGRSADQTQTGEGNQEGLVCAPERQGGKHETGLLSTPWVIRWLRLEGELYARSVRKHRSRRQITERS